MELLLGVGMLSIAGALLAAGRALSNNPRHAGWVQDLLRGELVALVITVLLAFGASSLIGGYMSAESGLGLLETGAAIGAVVVIWIGAWRLSRPAEQAVPARPVKAHARRA